MPSGETREAASRASAGGSIASVDTSLRLLDAFEGGWLRLIVDSMTEGFGLLAPDFTILELNKEALRIDGRGRDEIVGRSQWAAYPNTEHSELGRLFKTAMSKRVPVSLEHRYAWDDGRTSWFETRALPVENGCLAIFYRDVTARHLGSERLRASEQRFKAAISAIEGVLWTNNAAGEMVGEQAGWAELTGQTFADYQGYGWSRAVHPDDARPTLVAWDAAVAAREPFVFEHRVRRHDGAWRLCAVRAVPIIDGDGAITEWVGVHRDITDYSDAQELLERNAQTFANLVVSNPFGIYVVDADFRLMEISQGARAVFAGIDPLIGRAFDDIIRILWREPFASEVVAHFRHTLATGEPYLSPSTVEQRANIEAVESYDWRIERIGLPDGRHGVVCYFYDLTERQAYEAKLTQALFDKDLLAREIDHRVKNSLAVIGSLLTMQRGASTSPETRAALDEAAARVIAVARVHERLHKSHALGVVAFADYLEEMCEDLDRSMSRRGVRLDCSVVPVDLPAERAMSLGLIANELVTNAFKHGCAAGATTIGVQLDRTAETVILTVRDDGAGIPAAGGEGAPSLGFKLIDALARQLDAKTRFPVPGEPASFVIEIAAR